MRVDNSARSVGIIRFALIFYNTKICCVFSLESPHWGDSIEYTQYPVFKKKKKKKEEPHKIIPNLQPRDFFQGTQEWVRKSRGKRAISVRAIEVLLYISDLCSCSLRQSGQTVVVSAKIIYSHYCSIRIQNHFIKCIDFQSDNFQANCFRIS